MKKIPENSSIQFDLLMPMKFMQLSFEDKTWLNAYLGTFVLLRPGSDTKAVIPKFNKIYSSYAKEQVAENMKTYGFDPKISYGLQALADIHLNPMGASSENGIIKGSSPVFSYLFMGIAIFIFIMASINFINISIADSLKRGKEVGVRKIIGGSRWQIILQFLRESAVLCIVAFIIAVFITTISLPFFNQLTGKQILLVESFNIKLLLSFVAVLAVVILLTGFYPAWTLSGFNAKEVLYNKLKLSGNNVFRKSLVVFQFSLAVFLLIATLVYYSQMNFIRTKDLGYDPHEIIQTHILGNKEVSPIYQFLRNELSREPSIKAISFGGGENSYKVKIGNRDIMAVHKVIDENYLPAMEIPLKAGRNLSASFPYDSSHSVIVNEAFVKAAGLEHPIGVQLKTDEYFDKEPKTIIGVVKDYHIGSLREPIKPLVMFMNSWYGGAIFVKVEKSRQKQGMAALEKAYKTVMPQAVYRYDFLDELNAKQYEQEQRWQQVISVATMLSIAICCLGLFGLAHLATHQRIKEIGIRKVLGATVTQVVVLLSAGFLRLVLLAIVIATPVAWFIMNKWLQDFAYRVSIGSGILMLSALISVFIALVAVSFQAIKAAAANPVESLRTE